LKNGTGSELIDWKAGKNGDVSVPVPVFQPPVRPKSCLRRSFAASATNYQRRRIGSRLLLLQFQSTEPTGSPHV